MEIEKLAHMANQIAAYFRSYPDEEAKAGIHDHIVAFWTGRMREELIAAGPHEGLDPLVIEAFHGTKRADSPLLPGVTEPALAGAVGSDAG
ncbi:MAG: formate dehydrogenase subunit delta [Pseudomonadota bacterium]|nr:formate dehydrogenase subunit delta [Pseudomonadota bacterium]